MMAGHQEQVIDGIEDETDIKNIIVRLKTSEISHPWRFEEIDMPEVRDDLLIRLVILLVDKATALRFYNCTLPPIFYQSLADCLRRNNSRSLRELGFLCFQDDISVVMDAVKSNAQLTLLELNEVACINHNTLVFEIIETNRELRVLDLAFNELGDDFVQSIAESLGRARGSSRLYKLALHDCNFGDEGLIALSNVLSSDEEVLDENGAKKCGLYLRELMVDHNSFTDEGMQELQMALRTVKKNNANVCRMFPAGYLPQFCDDETIEESILYSLKRNRTLEGIDRLSQEDAPSAAWCYAISRPRHHHTDLVFWLLKRTPHFFNRNEAAGVDQYIRLDEESTQKLPGRKRARE